MAVDIPDAARDARRLMAFALDIGADRLTLVVRDPMPAAAAAIFDDLIAQRLRRKPVSHLVGGRWFYDRWFRVTPDTLDPRPETEILIELALGAPFATVLDLGTGTGAIVITLLAERLEARGVGTDLSAEAILIAGENAATHGVQDRLVLPVSDWWDDVGGRYDLIVSNPPYIAADEMQDLAPEVRAWEPRLALTDEADGLSAYRAIASQAAAHLNPQGRLIVEIGPTQGDAVAELFKKFGLCAISVHQDLDGRDRVVLAGRNPA